MNETPQQQEQRTASAQGNAQITAAQQEARTNSAQLQPLKKNSALDRIALVNQTKGFGIALTPYYRIPGRKTKHEPCILCKAPTMFALDTAGAMEARCLFCAQNLNAGKKGFRSRIGQLLVDKQLISPEQKDAILMKQKEVGKTAPRCNKFIRLAVDMNFVSEKDAMDEWAAGFSFDFGASFNVDGECLRLLEKEICRRHAVACVGKNKSTHLAAMEDPLDEEALLAIAEGLKTNVARLYIMAVTPAALKEALAQSSTGVILSPAAPLPTLHAENFQSEIEEITDSQMDLNQDLPEDAIKHEFSRILWEAAKKEASDIHLELNQRQELRIRYRIDGSMEPAQLLPAGCGDRIIRMLKKRADIRLDDREDKASDGSFRLKICGRVYEFRVSVVPAQFGPNCVVRLFDRSAPVMTPEQLGFDARSYAAFIEAASEGASGIAIVSGPTGSGKSTSLEAFIHRRAETDTEVVITMEDPIEKIIPNCVQIPINMSLEHRTYRAILPAILRQDPDMVVIGEIRDEITVQAAFEAAASGAFVLATVHANDAAGVITRFRTLRGDAYLISQTTKLIIAQRLVRKLCPLCKISTTITADALRSYGFYYDGPKELKVFTAKKEGCEMCNRGYKGRVAVVETLKVTPAIREMILQGIAANEIRAEAIRGGMYTLKRSGLEKVIQRITSVDEVLCECGGLEADPTFDVMKKPAAANAALDGSVEEIAA